MINLGEDGMLPEHGKDQLQVLVNSMGNKQW